MKAPLTPRLGDIAPDGVAIRIAWDEFVPGASVFVPCINTQAAVDQILYVAKLQKKQLETRVTIENGLYGVRVWRVM